jgi:GDPmannose 4,6-dehydratase
VRIAAGQQDRLYLGNIDIQRDWGWAEDYVVAMYLMLQQEESDDYVIATGESYKLAEFIEIAFRLVGLDWREYVVSDKGLCRPTDIAVSRGNPAKARERLGIGNRFVGLIRQRPNLAKRVEGIEQDNPTALKIPNIPCD